METKTYTLNGRVLKIKVPNDNSRPDMLNIAKFRKPLNIGTVSNSILASEFFEDIEFQINFLKDKPLSSESLLEAFLASCDKHVEKFNRIIDHDLDSYLDTMLILTCAIVDADKMVPFTDNQGQELRDTFLQCAYKAFQLVIYVHHYDNLGKSSLTSKPSLVKLTELK
ncbi:hypothetical protein ABIB40_001551 [Pedobacter sp. UYP30]|uniref:hypothetical protein n=1 Tax=Pedobacter sp. UYP30 TaxID=1756400 RepID=UPI00339B48FE